MNLTKSTQATGAFAGFTGALAADYEAMIEMDAD